MNYLLLAALVFAVGASITRLVTKDSLFEPLRERWEGHFAYQQDKIIAKVAELLPADTAKWDNPRHSRLERRMALLHEVGDRAEEEAPVPWRVRGKRRQLGRPWSTMSDRLVWWKSWMDFISCPWCVGFWVFLALWSTVWLAILGVHAQAWGVSFGALVVPLALAYRWTYAVVASKLDND